mgnify:FL=1
MLDLILANSDNLTISTSHCDHPLVKEDKYHEALCTIDLTVLENTTNVDDIMNCFYSNLYDSFDIYVPKKLYGKSKYPVWFSPEIKANLKTKEYYRRKWLKSKIPYFFSEFKRMRTLVKLQVLHKHNGNKY